jgi:non-ribosomal peptide synthetase component F
MVLLALYYVLLSRVSHQEDIIVGTAVAGRRHADLEKVIGMFVNMLALRNCPTGEKRFVDFLKEVKQRTLEAFENQDYSFGDLVEELAEGRKMNRHPLFDVAFAVENINTKTQEEQEAADPRTRADANTRPIQFEDTTTKFELTLTANEVGKNINFTFQYCTKLYKAETISRLINYFKTIVSSVLKDPTQEISKIDIMDETTREELIKKMRGEDYNFIETDRDVPGRTAGLDAEFDY